MDNDSDNLSSLPEEFIDALQEVGNIGSGHAANALADLLNRRVDMSLPKFRLLTLENISQISWGNKNPLDPYAFVMLESTGDFKFIILVIFDKTTLMHVLNLISGDISFLQQIDLNELSNFDKSTITEIGSILGLHYLTAIGEFLGVEFNDKNLKVSINAPQLLIENGETVLTSIASRYDSDFVNIVNIECDIYTTDNVLHPSVVLIPEESAIRRSINAMFGSGSATK